ncbi:MAG: lycopene cyclase domain-containing protein [Bacteroidia bacterium]|nr:lycopene cyclase domain-containing protein [Bacteroidia bacterium]
MPLYLSLEICSIIIPLIFSFEKKIGFYKKWPFLFVSIFITGMFFIPADIFFTQKGIWGFNPRYISDILIAGLPLEEWLFFVIIPYSSIFIHYVIIGYLPRVVLPANLVRIITAIILAGLMLIIITNFDKQYTLFSSSVMAIALFVSLLNKNSVLNIFYITFPIILIPFLIVNGILTGTLINDEVVWYNGAEIKGIRLLTIPVEDIAYGFSLILINLLIMGYLQKLFIKKAGSKIEP